MSDQGREIAERYSATSYRVVHSLARLAGDEGACDTSEMVCEMTNGVERHTPTPNIMKRRRRECHDHDQGSVLTGFSLIGAGSVLVWRTAIPERRRPALLMMENGDERDGVGSR